MYCTFKCAENTKFLVRASYLEIYKEEIRDLLGKDTKQKLEVCCSFIYSIYSIIHVLILQVKIHT